MSKQYAGADRRRYPRANGRFIVSYRVIPKNNNADISQTKNLSLGGMLLTTNCQFLVGTNLALEIRLPFDPDSIMIIAKVLESQEITKGVIYDTRLIFLAVDEKHRKIVDETVGYYLRKVNL
ncbi:MAG: PilZ domain-containing protein [Candidatus Omnitrophota bacterium]|nr:PilZ domain-containing protein [Candidatus Omnitrophota bacterium]